MDRPLISFALFCYNQEDFIEEAVRAALAQTYSPLQIVISDDGSKDRSFDIIQKIISSYHGPHEIVLNRNEQNLGIGPHVNKVMTELVKGELIVTAAGDDISVPERTETVFRAWDATGRRADSILNGYQRMTIDGELRDVKTPTRQMCFWNETIMSHCKKNIPMIMPGCTQSCSAKVFGKFGKILYAPHIEDDTITLRALSMGGVLLIPEVLTKWRMAGAVSKVKSQEFMWEQDRAYRYEVAEQLMADSAKMDNLSSWNRFTIRYVARANMLIANPKSIIIRLVGVLLLSFVCSPATTFRNFKRVHRKVGAIHWRKMLGSAKRERRI